MKNTRNIILKVKDKNDKKFHLMCSIYNETGSRIQDISYPIRIENQQEDFNSVLKSLSSIKVFNFNFRTEDNELNKLLFNYLHANHIFEEKKSTPKILNDKIIYPLDKNTIHMYIGIETDINTKTTECKILGCDSNKERVIKKEIYENRKLDDQLFMNEIKKEIIKFQNEGKTIKLYGRGLIFSLFHKINKELIEEGRNSVELRDGTGVLSVESAHKRIKKHMKEFYDDLNNLKDKYVYFLDGSVSESGDRYASAFLCRNTNEVISKQTKLNENVSSGHKVNESEVIALKNAVEYMIMNAQNDKPVYLVFDSDNIATKLKKGLNNEFPDRITNIDLIMQEICEKIKNNKLDIRVNVLKSHSENFIHDIFKYNTIVDEFARQSLNKGSQIKKLDVKK